MSDGIYYLEYNIILQGRQRKERKISPRFLQGKKGQPNNKNWMTKSVGYNSILAQLQEDTTETLAEVFNYEVQKIKPSNINLP